MALNPLTRPIRLAEVQKEQGALDRRDGALYPSVS